MADGPEAGLAAVDAIDGLDDYRYLHSTRADLLRRLGRDDEARAAYERALELTPNGAEREFLEAQAQLGIAATASISSSAPGTASAETSTSVLAGRASPKNSMRTGLIRARSSTSSRKSVDLDDVVEAAAGGLEHELHVPEDLARLLDDVALADELPLGVDRDDPGDEQQPAGRDRVGVVADRLGQSLDAVLLAVVAHGPDRTIGGVEPQFVDFDDVREFELAAGVTGRPLFGEGAMLNLIEFEPGVDRAAPQPRARAARASSCAGMQVLIVDGEEHALRADGGLRPARRRRALRLLRPRGGDSSSTSSGRSARTTGSAGMRCRREPAAAALAAAALARSRSRTCCRRRRPDPARRRERRADLADPLPGPRRAGAQGLPRAARAGTGRATTRRIPLIISPHGRGVPAIDNVHAVGQPPLVRPLRGDQPGGAGAPADALRLGRPRRRSRPGARCRRSPQAHCPGCGSTRTGCTRSAAAWAARRRCCSSRATRTCSPEPPPSTRRRTWPRATSPSPQLRFGASLQERARLEVGGTPLADPRGYRVAQPARLGEADRVLRRAAPDLVEPQATGSSRTRRTSRARSTATSSA